jgi:hypothetical protein
MILKLFQDAGFFPYDSWPHHTPPEEGYKIDNLFGSSYTTSISILGNCHASLDFNMRINHNLVGLHCSFIGA